ncbi:MAG: HalOD1 output domain-containing protein [Halosimplex sp.]
MSQVPRRTGRAGQDPTTRDVPDDQPISQIVVETVAALEGVEPTDLSATLYEALDPEALDSLHRSTDGRDGSLRIAFTFGGYEVVVESGDRITVRDLSESRVR